MSMLPSDAHRRLPSPPREAPCAQHAPEIAIAIHWPEHWDTAAYPTLESALSEVFGWFVCSQCQPPERMFTLTEIGTACAEAGITDATCERLTEQLEKNNG